MTSVIGLGYTPMANTASANKVNITNSRVLMSVSLATLALATSPKYTRLTIHKV